ncbi:MAG: sugar phosphate isomerase/epimerase [Armatimonadetes bacterium]|nr:sugar phosphate isomerase/epimerase [Armatimonadota bacterium]
MRVESQLCLVGWTYRHWPMRRLFEAAADHGFGAVEIRPCADADLCSIDGIGLALEQASRLARQHQVRVAVAYLHNFVVTSPDQLVRRNPTYFSPDVLSQLADSGTGLVHLLLERVRPDGSHVLASDEADEADFSACREALEVLAEALEPHGLRAAVEVRPGTIADSFEGALWTSGHLDHETVGVSVDFANLLLTDRHLNLAEAVHSMQGRMRYTHLKNLKLYPWGHDWDIPLEAGCIDYFEVLSALEQSGYSGLLGLEYCGQGDPDAFVRRDLDYLRWLEKRLNQADRWKPERPTPRG